MCGFCLWYYDVMKIIFLNVWDGKQENELREFLNVEVGSTDIFCFQETGENFREKFGALFGDFVDVNEYRIGFKEGDVMEDYALTTYVKKSLDLIKSEVLFCEPHADGNSYGMGIDVTVNIEGTSLHILNYHGFSRPKDKLDTKERIIQAERIAEHYAKVPGPKILGGDFNFLPSTQSYKTIKGDDYRELIMDKGIPTTRNELYWDRRGLDHKYSDYCFISPEITVDSFEVPAIKVSDHLPLILEFSVGN